MLTRALGQVIDEWLQAERTAPRKQRHTGQRLFERLAKEHGYSGAAVTVQMYVRRRRRERGQSKQALVAQAYRPGEEAQVDWYEAAVDFPEGRRTVQFFVMRACFSGREFHQAFTRQTQQAFLEGHVAAFAYVGGAFARIRYDHLGAAVKKVLRGRHRAETERFVALRSHDLFEADFCRPGLAGAHEKGGVEGAVGRFRRRYRVAVPPVKDLAALNRSLRAACEETNQRQMTGRVNSVQGPWAQECAALRALPALPWGSAQVSPCRVDSQGRIRVRTNPYSVPAAWVGKRVEVRLHAESLEVIQGGQVVAPHERLQGRCGERLVLDHEPGAAPAQARRATPRPGAAAGAGPGDVSRRV